MDSKHLIFQQRGAVRLHSPRMRLLGTEISPWIWWASRPIGKLECYDDAIMVKAWPIQVSVSLQEIDLVEFKKLNVWRALLGEKLEISRRGVAPNRIDFSWYGLSPIVQVLEDRGVKVLRK